MFRVPLLFALALGVAFGVGILSSVMALKATAGFGAITLGPWTAFPDAQTINADPYAKAHRARAGKLLLGGAEGLSFVASVDSDGAGLTSTCDYEINGITPPARFWTLHVDDTDDAVTAPGDGRPAGLNAWTALRRADGTFSIGISAEAKPGNWLALDTTGPFRLVLTLLDTPTAGSSGVIDLAMPAILRKGCHA